MSTGQRLGDRLVFVDSGAYAASVLVRDSNHRRAVAVFEELARGRWQLVTPNFVTAETHSLVLARSG